MGLLRIYATGDFRGEAGVATRLPGHRPRTEAPSRAGSPSRSRKSHPRGGDRCPPSAAGPRCEALQAVPLPSAINPPPPKPKGTYSGSPGELASLPALLAGRREEKGGGGRPASCAPPPAAARLASPPAACQPPPRSALTTKRHLPALPPASPSPRQAAARA